VWEQNNINNCLLFLARINFENNFFLIYFQRKIILKTIIITILNATSLFFFFFEKHFDILQKASSHQDAEETKPKSSPLQATTITNVQAFICIE